MTIGPTAFILLFVFTGFVLLVLGVIMGLYFMRSNKKPVKKDQTKPLSSVQPQENNPENPDEEIIEVQFTKLVTLGRMDSDDRFSVQIDDEWISDPAELTFVQRDRLEKNLRELQNWLHLENIEELPKEPVQKVASVKTEVAAPIVNQQAAEKHKRPLSIVEQVDEIFQDMIENTPIKEQNVRLTEMHNKGVIVWIGNEYYEGIQAVPDENIKQTIKQAVKKWEETIGR